MNVLDQNIMQGPFDIWYALRVLVYLERLSLDRKASEFVGSRAQDFKAFTSILC